MSLKIDGHFLYFKKIIEMAMSFYKNAYVIVKMILKQKIWHSTAY